MNARTFRWMARIGKYTSQARQALVDLLYPPTCLYCLDTLEASELSPAKIHSAWFCRPCHRALTAKRWHACPRCAAPTIGGRCVYCQQRAYAFDRAIALGLYEKVLKEAVLRTKQRRFEDLTLGLGRLLGEHLRLFEASASSDSIVAGHVLRLTKSSCLIHQGPEPLDAVIPVPSHWTRRWSRGVQGSALLAEGLASVARLPVVHGLSSCRRTRKQGTLPVERRFENVRGVFRVGKRYDFAEARLLLVDDVMTTGATTSEAARALKRAGAAHVCVIVLARGTGQHSPPAYHGAETENLAE